MGLLVVVGLRAWLRRFGEAAMGLESLSQKYFLREPGLRMDGVPLVYLGTQQPTPTQGI